MSELTKNAPPLPDGPVGPTTKNPRRLVLYGPPKVGKTTFAAQLEGNLILDLESGTETATAFKVPVKDFEDLLYWGNKIIADESHLKFITVDTISALEDWCEWDATEAYMRSIIGKNFNRNKDGTVLPKEEWESVLSLSNGAGYLWLRLSFKSWLTRLSRLAENMILIAHLKDKFIERQGKEVSAKDLDLTGKIRSITSANADAIGYIYRNKEGLRVNFASSETIICGARPEHLRGADIPADWSKIFIQ